MFELIKTAIYSPTVLILTVIYYFAASITTFDIRLIQAKRTGSRVPMLPSWVAIFIFIHIGIFMYLFFFINWQYAVLIFVIKYILKVLPVLETIGELIMKPFLIEKK